jgi:alpha-ketoglutarate-dependent taurine dioxygenase
LIQRYDRPHINEPVPTIMLDHMSQHLRRCGWASVSPDADGAPIAERAAELATVLGEIVAPRRNGVSESVSPRSATDARMPSLSRKFGLGFLPLHCDTAHWMVPCRYVVLACVETGHVDAPTLLLDTSSLDLSDAERLLARSACFLVRNGRRSFYASMMDSHRSFVRVDPGCMEPVTETAVEAMSLYSYDRQRHKTAHFHWKIGKILVIDNWRVLHGRGNNTPVDPTRRLLRIYVQ